MRSEDAGLDAGIPRAAVRAAWVGIALIVISAASITQADPDLWGHVRFGADILYGQGLPSVDPYSFTQDRPWINHEWLSELMMGTAWTLFGGSGLSLLKAALTVCGLWLIWAALSRVDPTARIPIMGATVVGVAPLLQTLRPQLWTFVCLAILCRVLVSGSTRARWGLPVLFAAWANVHGGWIVGMGALGMWAAASAWRDGRWLHWGALLAVSLAATLINPYGPGLWAFLAETVRLTRPSIEEWQPLWAFGPERWLPWLLTVGAALWVLWRREADTWPALLAVLLSAYAALRVARMSPLAVEAAVLLFAPIVARRFPARVQHLPIRSAREAVVLAVCALVAGLGAGGWTASRSLDCVTVDQVSMPEPEPVRLLASAPDGRLVTFFNWGEYAIWHLGPRIRVSMDGRRETVYSEQRIAEHDAILEGRDAGSILEAWRAEYVWLPASSEGARRWLVGNGYQVRLETARSFVAVREDVVARIPGVAGGSHVNAGRRCFPG